MKKVNDVEILDLLPYTFNDPKDIALSKALKKVTTYVYDVLSSNVILWADIDNAKEEFLDVMAAELDCPFYDVNMTIEQKRAIVKSSFAYNSRIGTVSSVKKALEATFGGGKVSEWYKYGGRPYYFKVEITRSDGIHPDIDNYNYFLKMLEKVKNKRSKLEAVETNETLPKTTIYYGGVVTRIQDSLSIPVDFASNDNTPCGVENIGVFMYDVEHGRSYPAQKYNTFEDIKNMAYEEINDKTYAELLYKED